MKTIGERRIMAQWIAHPQIRVTIQKGSIIAAALGDLNWAAGIGTFQMQEIIPKRRAKRTS